MLVKNNYYISNPYKELIEAGDFVSGWSRGLPENQSEEFQKGSFSKNTQQYVENNSHNLSHKIHHISQDYCLIGTFSGCPLIQILSIKVVFQPK